MGPTNDDIEDLDSSTNPYPVTPHNSNPLPVVPKGIYVGTGGDVTLRGAHPNAVDVVYRNVPSGGYIAVRAKFIRATGTTASNLVAEA